MSEPSIAPPVLGAAEGEAGPPVPVAESRAPGAGYRWLLMAASLVVVVAGLKAAAPVVLPLLVAVFLALLSYPITIFLIHRGLKLGWSVILTVIIEGMVLSVLAIVVTGAVNEFVTTAPVYLEQLFQRYQSAVQELEARGVDVARYLERFDPTSLLAPARGLLGNAVAGLASVMSFLTLVLLMLVCLLYEGAKLPRKLELAFGRLATPSRVYRRVTRDLQQYLAVKTASSALTGVLIGLWTGFLGVPFPLVWGLTAFLLNYIPTIGSIVAAIPAVLVALITGGLGTAALVALGYLVANFAIGNVAEPMLMGRQFGLATFVVFLSLIFWGWLWGLVGALLSVPLTMVVKIVLEQNPNARWAVVMLSKAPPAS